MKLLKDQKVNNMTKKEKILAVATLTYFILLVLCLLMLFICIPLQVKGVEIFVLIFMATLIVGYLILALIIGVGAGLAYSKYVAKPVYTAKSAVMACALVPRSTATRRPASAARAAPRSKRGGVNLWQAE